MPEEFDENFIYNPYIAAIADKDEAGQRQFFEGFYRLGQPLKDFLTSPGTTARIKSIFDTGMAPQEYALAIAKVVAFAATGEVPISSIGELLTKLGLLPEQAAKISAVLVDLLEPVIAERGRASAAPNLQPLSPLTRPTETGPRRIIDLRKQPPNA